MQRLKVANDTEAEKLRGIDLNYMSDEDDGEGDQTGLWVVSSPSWRSQELNRLLSVLHERANSKENSSKHPKNPRVRGPPSSRPAPKNAPQWAVRIERREPEREPDREPERQQPTVSGRRARMSSESSDDDTPNRGRRHLTTNRSLFPGNLLLKLYMLGASRDDFLPCISLNSKGQRLLISELYTYRCLKSTSCYTLYSFYDQCVSSISVIY